MTGLRPHSCLHLRVIGHAPFATCFLALASGCSSIDLGSARQLGAAGCDVACPGEEAVLLSRTEYARALDAEAFFHGYAGTPVPEQLLLDYRSIQSELTARKQVYARLADAYEAFRALAEHDAADGFETAVNQLGDAVNGYAAVFNKAASLTSADKDALARIGGRIGSHIQKRKIKRSSALIRERLTSFARLLDDPLVRAQSTDFKKSLAASRAAAVTMLWEEGVLDPSPLISELGGEAGLKASRDAAKIITDSKNGFVKEGLGAVVASRLVRRLDLIEQGHDASVQTLKELTALHEKLEAGEPVSLARLHQVAAELRLATDLQTAKATASE